MKIKTISTLIAGTGKILRNSSALLKRKAAGFVERNCIKDNYVTREEHDALRKAFLKLEQENREKN